MQAQQSTDVKASSPPEGFMPLTQAAAKLGLRYAVVRDLALTGRLTIQWVGSRVYVSIASVEAFEAN